MGQIRLAQLLEGPGFAEIQALLQHAHPTLRLTLARVEGESTLRTEQGGVRVFWIYRGQGEVFLPRGYRTQEGDGRPLPAGYQAEPIAPAFAHLLGTVRDGLATVVPAAMVPVRAILGRWKGAVFIGDFAGDLWKLEQLQRPWAQDAGVETALQALFGIYREPGHSVKQLDSWEPLNAGDQLIACDEEAVKVRGQFHCLALEHTGRRTRHVSTARRLRYLCDTAGGCNPDFDPFRRLPLTWCMNYPGETGDGLNFTNSHVVNIPKETSPTHFHPLKPIGGGWAQTEMYLVLDPETYRLNTSGRPASLLIFPDLKDLARFEQHSLRPGSFVYIPPGTGHRGLDVFVNVLTVPGFKPHNELYLDGAIAKTAGARAPYNADLLDLQPGRASA